jgi:Protein of unknown function (DUF1064)
VRINNKYKAIPVVVDGIRFASKAEANRYQQLRILEHAGEVLSFEIQPRFELPAGIRYIADFRVHWKDGHTTIEDVKGVMTAVFRLKKKLFEAQYGQLTLITKKSSGRVPRVQ